MRPKKTILCVDDNEQALSVRKFMLETRGYRVLTALHGADALELISLGGVDLVLSDLLMPLMDGNELVRRMKAIAPDVPMLLISGTVKAFDRASHADAFMPKGCCSPLELLERIRLMIARKRGPKKHSVLRPLIPALSGAESLSGADLIGDDIAERAPGSSGDAISQREAQHQEVSRDRGLDRRLAHREQDLREPLNSARCSTASVAS